METTQPPSAIAESPTPQAPSDEYCAPCIETVMTAQQLEREVQYAGAVPSAV